MEKGSVMAMVLKQAETLFERFETTLELWADRVL